MYFNGDLRFKIFSLQTFISFDEFLVCQQQNFTDLCCQRMYAYDVINCVTNNTKGLVSQFWRFYGGTGFFRKHQKSTESFIRFQDLGQDCVDLSKAYERRIYSNNHIQFKKGISVSSRVPDPYSLLQEVYFLTLACDISMLPKGDPIFRKF
jgi:hypothetical protein